MSEICASGRAEQMQVRSGRLHREQIARFFFVPFSDVDIVFYQISCAAVALLNEGTSEGLVHAWRVQVSVQNLPHPFDIFSDMTLFSGCATKCCSLIHQTYH